MSGIGGTIGIDGVVGITVVGDDDGLVVVGLGSLDDLTDAVVNGPDSLGDGVVDTSVTPISPLAKFTTMKSYS